MKFFLLSFLLVTALFTHAQQNKVSSLPAGVYEVQKAKNGTGFSGDIILLDEGRYKLRNETEVSEYKFSATAQRILFISGPLKGIYAKTVINGGVPAILLPKKENEALGYKLAEADVWAFYKRKGQ